MTKSGMNLQDSFLNQVRKENTEIMLMLLDGSRLNGFVRGFDNFTVIMNVRGAQHLIYKHAISQIVSRRAPHGEGEREHREGGQAHGAPPQEGGAPGEEQPQQQSQQQPSQPQMPQQQPQQHPQGHTENHRREGGAPRRERGGDQRGEHRGEPRGERNDEHANKSKFNTLDFSTIKIENEKQA